MKMTEYPKGSLPGLSEAQVLTSRAAHGSNDLPAVRGKGFLSKLKDSFADPIIRILLVALGVNFLMMFRDGGIWETVGIAVAVALATVVSALSEYSSEVAFRQLQSEAGEQRCRVRREGKVADIPPGELVVGDVVLIGAGERIAADGILIAGGLSVDQSPLNGESKEANKRPATAGESPREPGSADRLFRGCTVTEGEGEMRVTHVGKSTLYGGLATELGESGEESPLRKRLAKLAKQISTLGYTAAVLVMAADLSRELFIMAQPSPRSVLEAALHAVMLGLTVVVVAVPEGLPMMITLVLSRNMLTMTKNGVMVRKLVGIETAGCIGQLFTDKTGTLTKGVMSVSGLIGTEGELKRISRQPGWMRERYRDTVRYNCSSTRDQNGRAVGGNATDRALLSGIGREVLMRSKVLWSIPFDSERKYSAACWQGEEGMRLSVKGAPEKLLAHCKSCYGAEGRIRPMTDADRDRLSAAMIRQSEQGGRLLCLAFGEVAEESDVRAGHFPPLAFLCLAVLRDEPRREAAGAVRQLKEAGITVTMVTGDGEGTACAVAAACGILPSRGKSGVYSGGELDKMDEEALCRLLPEMRVIYRALPSHKSRLVRAAQRSDTVVGMTGDGVNDAPALKKADVGFAMGSGTEVAKEAGDIVISDNNIASIARAVLYGRTVFKSIRKFIVFQLTMNMCAVLVSLICPFLGIETPVTVMQMLWLNLIMDTLGALAFAAEPPLARYMKEKPLSRKESVLSREMILQIAVTGGYTVLLSLGFLFCPWLQRPIRSHPQGLYLLTAFFGLFVFSGIWSSFCARTERRFLGAELKKNPSFVLIMGAVAGIQIMMIYFGGSLFRTTPLTGEELRYVLLLAATVIPVDLARKQILCMIRNKRAKKHRRHE